MTLTTKLQNIKLNEGSRRIHEQKPTAKKIFKQKT